MIADHPLVRTHAGPRWVEIDLDAIMHNVEAVKSLLKPETRLMAVVKADAYGFGAVEVSKAVLEAGAEMLAVTSIDEGVELREQGIEAPILVFTPLFKEELKIAAAWNLIGTVTSLDSLEKIYAEGAGEKGGIPGRVHLKVNTGMNRLGIAPNQVAECCRLAVNIPGMEVEGVYSHFATTPGQGKPFVEKQFEVFSQVITDLEEHNLHIPIKHICNSAAALDMPQMHLDMVRVGNLLYGQLPDGSKSEIQLKDPWKARAKIVSVGQVLPGETVGYGCDFKAKQKTRVGIIPLGFADGLDIAPNFKPKSLGDLLRMLAKTVLSFFGRRVGTPLVTWNGKPLDLVGRIGMQVAAVDLSHRQDVDLGDTVEVFLRRTTAGRKLPRVYLLRKEVKSIRTAGNYVAAEYKAMKSE